MCSDRVRVRVACWLDSRRYDLSGKHQWAMQGPPPLNSLEPHPTPHLKREKVEDVLEISAREIASLQYVVVLVLLQTVRQLGPDGHYAASLHPPQQPHWTLAQQLPARLAPGARRPLRGRQHEAPQTGTRFLLRLEPEVKLELR